MPKQDKINLPTAVQIAELKRSLPIVLGNQAKNFFESSFDKGGFEGDNGFEKWKEVKRREPGTKEYKYTKSPWREKPILVQRARLFRAVSASLRQATFNKIRLVVPIKYGAIQNEGGTIHMQPRQQVIHFKNKRVKGSKSKRAVFSSVKGAHFAQKVEVGAYDINIPARPFMKHSRALEKQQLETIVKATAEIFIKNNSIK